MKLANLGPVMCAHWGKCSQLTTITTKQNSTSNLLTHTNIDDEAPNNAESIIVVRIANVKHENFQAGQRHHIRYDRQRVMNSWQRMWVIWCQVQWNHKISDGFIVWSYCEQFPVMHSFFSLIIRGVLEIDTKIFVFLRLPCGVVFVRR